MLGLDLDILFIGHLFKHDKEMFEEEIKVLKASSPSVVVEQSLLWNEEGPNLVTFNAISGSTEKAKSKVE